MLVPAVSVAAGDRVYLAVPGLIEEAAGRPLPLGRVLAWVPQREWSPGSSEYGVAICSEGGVAICSKGRSRSPIWWAELGDLLVEAPE